MTQREMERRTSCTKKLLGATRSFTNASPVEREIHYILNFVLLELLCASGEMSVSPLGSDLLFCFAGIILCMKGGGGRLSPPPLEVIYSPS